MIGSNTFSILVVDDSMEYREILSNTLRSQGHDVVSASSGNEALALLNKHVVDLVISDLQMPDGDGFWLLSKIRERSLALPVLLVSGHSSMTEERAKLAGAIGFVAKPFQIEALLTYLNTVFIQIGV